MTEHPFVKLLMLKPGGNCRIIITTMGNGCRGENWYHFDGKNHHLVDTKEGRPTTKEHN